MGIKIKPQKGPQEAFLATRADICIYGGGAGSGKTYGLLMEPTRHIDNSKFNAVVIRRTVPQIMNPGGLWDESCGLYPLLGAYQNKSQIEWIFKSGMKIKFGHIQYDDDRYQWQGSQIPLIEWDELTHFSWRVFNYLLSRNRSTCGVDPYIRATCNPDPDHWLRPFLDWWIDPDTGLPIKERSGVIRYFAVINDRVEWGRSKAELKKRFGNNCLPKSATFIPALLKDNKILTEKNPEYLANLEALDRVERARLKDGNWNIRATAGMLFRREWFEFIDALPADIVRVCRFWDRAATEPGPGKDPDWTAGIKLGMDERGVFYVLDVSRFRATPLKVESGIKNTASRDGNSCIVGLAKDPGQAGKMEAGYLARKLAGYRVEILPEMKDKVTRASPVSAQAEVGNIKILRGPWNEEFFRELEQFPEGKHDDQVDALSGGFYTLTGKKRPGIGTL
jgi:predicted phage terminase large subunit-like protein